MWTRRSYHVGDEAIGLAAELQLRRRGFEVVRISRMHPWGLQPGQQGPTIESLRFPWPPVDRQRYLGEIRRVLAGDASALPPDDQVHRFAAELAQVDALVIGGGGSLNSRYGWLLYERLVAALIAHSQGMPVIISGQSLGPELSPADRPVLAELLQLAELVGLRDADSVALARRLCPDHPALGAVCDEVILLDTDRDQPLQEGIDVTLAADPGPFDQATYIEVMAALVETLASRTGAPVRLVPHMARPGRHDVDEDAHRRLAEALSMPVSRRVIDTALDTVGSSATARWVLTTRFHPVVLGLLAGSAVLPVALDRYAASRMDGAMANWGEQAGSVPFAALWRPGQGPDQELIDELVEALISRAEQHDVGSGVGIRERLRTRQEAWWDRIAAVLTHSPVPVDEPDAPDLPGAPEARRYWPADIAARLAPFVDPAGPPTVSVIMRTRDRPLLLERAPTDVAAQTRVDWQLIVINDGGSVADCERAVDNVRPWLGGRVQVLHNVSSAGMEAASNQGLERALGEFVVVHDDDDCWAPTFLQEGLAHLEAHPEQMGVMTRTIEVFEEQHGVEFVETRRAPFNGWLHEIVLIDFLKENRAVPISFLYRRTAHAGIGRYDEQLQVIGDWDFHLRFLSHFEVGFIDRPLAFWHKRTDPADSPNSVYQQDHRHWDLVVRDRAFREWVDRFGLGLPLYLNKTVEREVDRMDAPLAGLAEQLTRIEGRIDALDAELAGVDHQVRSAGALNLLRRKYWAARQAAGRLLGRGHQSYRRRGASAEKPPDSASH